MVFLRSCALSISNIVPYSYTGCKELEGSVLVFLWGPFGLLYGLLYQQSFLDLPVRLVMLDY